MKITRYAQSCVLIEAKGKRILVDPGVIGHDESLLEDWKDIDLLLVTHKHGDHCHEEAIKEINMSLSLSGTYSAFKDFLRALEGSSRMIEVENISFSASEKISEPISFSVRIKTHSY